MGNHRSFSTICDYLGTRKRYIFYRQGHGPSRHRGNSRQNLVEVKSPVPDRGYIQCAIGPRHRALGYPWKKTDRTIAQLIGGHRDWAESYITFGFPEYDRDQLVQSAKNWVADGHQALKMVVAVDAGGWREDARRVRLVRDAIGDDIDLMLDANYMFSPDQARQLCRAVEDCNLTWFEEPLYQNDARALADLRHHTNIPISAGQMEGHRWRLRELIEHQAVDILQPNCCYVGGYTEARKAAHLAQAYNMRVANGGGWPIFNMHTMAGLMNGWRTEFHLEMWEVGKLLFKGTPDPVDNRVQIPDAPGLGFEPDLDVLRDSRITQPDR